MATFEAWDRIEALIDELPEAELAYLTLKERPHDGADEQVGRVDLEDDPDLQRYLTTETQGDWDGTKHALLAWIKQTAEDNADGLERVTFKVSAYRHKGDHIKSRQFTFLDPDVRGRLVEMAPLDFNAYADSNLSEAVDNYAKIQVGGHYNELVRTLLGGTKSMIGQMLRVSRQQESVNARTVSHMSQQNDRLTKTLQEVTEAILIGRRAELDTELAAVREERETLERQRMTATAGKLIQETVETLVVGKSMSPEVKSLLASLQGTELEAIMKDPKFQAIINDPTQRVFMVQALNHMVSGFSNNAPPQPEENQENQASEANPAP